MRQYLSPISRVAFLTAAFVCLNPGRVAAATTPAANEPAAAPLAFIISVAPGHSMQQVHDAVVASAAARSWTIQDNTMDKVVIHHARHGYDATVTFDISGERVAAYCESYAVTGKGVRKYPKQPTTWLNYLREDISKQVGGVAVK